MSGADAFRKGSCHCGAVRFTVRLPREIRPRRCNCSICSMKGAVMIDVQKEDLSIDHGEELLTLYTFNTGEAKHRFCSRCGIHPFHQTRSDPGKYGVNAACIEGMSPYDWAEVPVFDGQNHPRDNGGAGRCAGVLRYEPAED